jgi:uncharacterized lipoprotein YehR (DUF1307 family)
MRKLTIALVVLCLSVSLISCDDSKKDKVECPVLGISLISLYINIKKKGFLTF